MDNNDFEQQFTQKVKSSVPPAQPVAVREEPSKLPLIIAAVLAAITLIESIVLVITLINYFQIINPIEDDNIAESDYFVDDGLSGYDENGSLIWLNLTCTNKDSGDKIVLTESKSFQQYKGSSVTESNTYTIVNDSLISLSGDEEKVLFYDGYSIADGLKIYDCDFDVEETTNTEEPSTE